MTGVLVVYICGLVPLRVLKQKMTAARVVVVRFMTILSKRSWQESVRKLRSLLLKFAVPVIKFVVVELLPLRGGNSANITVLCCSSLCNVLLRY